MLKIGISSRTSTGGTVVEGTNVRHIGLKRMAEQVTRKED